MESELTGIGNEIAQWHKLGDGRIHAEFRTDRDDAAENKAATPSAVSDATSDATAAVSAVSDAAPAATAAPSTPASATTSSSSATSTVPSSATASSTSSSDAAGRVRRLPGAYACEKYESEGLRPGAWTLLIILMVVFWGLVVLIFNLCTGVPDINTSDSEEQETSHRVGYAPLSPGAVMATEANAYSRASKPANPPPFGFAPGGAAAPGMMNDE